MRSTKLIKTAKAGAVIISLLMCALGLLLILFPGLSVDALGIILGAALLISGTVKIFGYLSRDLYRLAFQYDLALGLLLAALGVITLIRPRGAMEFICFAMGLTAMTDALLRIQTAVEARRFGIGRWWLIFAAAVTTAVIGILLVFKTAESTGALMVTLGVLLLADGILNLITVLTAVKIIQNQYPDAIDADYTEADE